MFFRPKLPETPPTCAGVPATNHQWLVCCSLPGSDGPPLRSSWDEVRGDKDEWQEPTQVAAEMATGLQQGFPLVSLGEWLLDKTSGKGRKEGGRKGGKGNWLEDT